MGDEKLGGFPPFKYVSLLTPPTLHLLALFFPVSSPSAHMLCNILDGQPMITEVSCPFMSCTLKPLNKYLLRE